VRRQASPRTEARSPCPPFLPFPTAVAAPRHRPPETQSVESRRRRPTCRFAARTGKRELPALALAAIYPFGQLRRGPLGAPPRVSRARPVVRRAASVTLRIAWSGARFARWLAHLAPRHRYETNGYIARGKSSSRISCPCGPYESWPSAADRRGCI